MRISIRRSQRAAGTEAQSLKSRRGVALVEVIVAMVLLGVAVSSLAGLVYSVSQSGMKNTGGAYRNGVLMQEVNRLEGIPYDSIAVGTQTYQVTTGNYKHTRVIRVEEPSPQRVKTVKIIVTPSNPMFKPDTVSFTRTKAKTSKVLCTTCQ
ncbi:MAG TPA: prepilin-type N-terminal cleavage/methylation domain-containing protein [Gemmatimonadaceae bacterium]|nr:prepilin-type N-terminal cleavage/methylation domain-containing protein [Gemmatimonadaceae bacterium]